MLRAYGRLIRMYPEDVRFAYGKEMLADLERGHADRRRQGPLALSGFVCARLLNLLIDVAAERVNALHSHRSFHGRGRPNPGVVRPPNMGKKEWFEAAFTQPSSQLDHNDTARR